MANGFKHNTVYDIDPKLFHRAAPREPIPVEVAMEVPLPLFSAKSLADFEGQATPYGKRAAIAPSHGRLVMFTEVVNISACSAVYLHQQLFKTIVVLEGYGILHLEDRENNPHGLEKIKLSPGDCHVLPAKTAYAFSTKDSFMVMAVTQEAYYDLELLVVEPAEETIGVIPVFGSHVPPRERFTSKAVEQSLAMAIAENKRIDTIEAEAAEAHVKDFDPFDPRWHGTDGINAVPYLPPEE